MISEERIEELAAPLDLPMEIEIFARAIEREAYKQGQEDMRERAAKELGFWIYTDGQCLEAIRNLEIEEPK